MKLITNEIIKKSKKCPIRTYEDTTYKDMLNKKVLMKIFFPIGRYTFYVLETDDLEDSTNPYITVYGYCISPISPDFDELGYEYLESFKEKIHGLEFERDISVRPLEKSLKECLERDGFTDTHIYNS